MENKGIVFKLKKGSTIVMTGEFEFTEITRRPEHTVGEEIRFRRGDVVSPGRLRPLALAASFIVLALLVTALWRPLFTVPAVYAYVGVDVNPSVEFAVDAGGRVIEAVALDDEAGWLLSRITSENNPVTEALQAYYELCAAEGYLDGGQVIIGLTAAGDQELDPALVASLTEWARITAEEPDAQADLYVLECRSMLREQAASMGLSTTEMAIVEEVQRSGLAVTPKEVRNQGLARAVERSGGNLQAAAHGLAVASYARGQKRGQMDDKADGWIAPGQVQSPGVKRGQGERTVNDGEPMPEELSNPDIVDKESEEPEKLQELTPRFDENCNGPVQDRSGAGNGGRRSSGGGGR